MKHNRINPGNDIPRKENQANRGGQTEKQNLNHRVHPSREKQMGEIRSERHSTGLTLIFAKSLFVTSGHLLKFVNTLRTDSNALLEKFFQCYG